MQIAMLAAGFSAGEADSLRRSMAAWKRKGGVHKFHDRIVGGMVERGYTAEFAQAHLPADRRLRRIRLPREPRRQLCAAGVCQLLAQAPRARRLPGRHAQQPAPGLLHAQPAGAGRPPPRRRGAPRRRAPPATGIARWSLGSASRRASACAWSRPARTRRPAHRRRRANSTPSPAPKTSPCAPPWTPATSKPWPPPTR